ncbi:hypothetical protein TSUD_57400, partial [Trifolium subterraneum]
EASDTSGLNKWKCKCSSFEGNQSNYLANCSKSCDCHSDSEGGASIWICICDPDGFPHVAEDGHSSNCFRACNCTWGTVGTSSGSKKHISSKVVVIILLICVICTTIALLTSVVCYIYRRDRSTNQSPIFSSDKDTSSGSTTNLISYRTGTSSVPETKLFINSPIYHFTGCFQKASFLFGSQKETFHGNIIQFSFAELESATDNFSATNLIGLGGSSYVYRGRLKDGNIVAVKRLKDHGGPEADSACFKEIELLARLHHCHLVPLLGYCLESKGKHVQRLLASPRLQDSRRVITELVDPQLKGNFPEEEVHIMAYLAKECLLLDPDTRPTMSEVVQILSSISPGKSRRRRSIPSSLFQELEEAEKQRQVPSSKFPTHNSSSLDIDHNPCVVNENKEAGPVSPEYMESLILLTSKSDGWLASEEEMVDIIEPRFESFCMTNGTVP